MDNRLDQVVAIARYGLQQLYLGARGSAFPVAKLYNLAWFESSRKRLPTVLLEDLFPRISGLPVQLHSAVPRVRGNLTVEELCVTGLICQRLQPHTVFEFGTFNGRTTLNLAANTPPQAKIYTLDLPKPGQTQFVTDKLDDPYQLGERTGSFYRESPFRQKVEQLWSDSAHFDETPFRQRIDLALIDASHEYEYVRNDTEKALRMVRPGGVILWHDYCGWYPGVTRYLHELLARHPVRHLAETHFGILVTPA